MKTHNDMTVQKGFRNKYHDLPLRKFFILTVLVTFSAVVLLSGLIIWGCIAFRHYLLPDSDSVYLSMEKTFEDGTITTESYLLKYGRSPEGLPELLIEEDGVPVALSSSIIKYSIEKIENSFDRLTPKRKLAYIGCGILMAAAPAILSLGGILFSSFYFYQRKLQIPLKLLSEATGQIAVQNLDFTLEYDCGDEMGDLCRSFSQMQKALYENNKKLWDALEERKRLQASIAHDLRNPIAIIQGYTEYLENKAAAGELKPEKALHIAQNLNMASKRLGQYTESIHTLNQLEDVEPVRETVSASRLAADMAADFTLLARQNDRVLHVSDSSALLPDSAISVDTAIVYRVLENVIGNSLRFSEKDIYLHFSMEDINASGENTFEHNNLLEAQLLTITVRDDGKGFPAEMLHKETGTVKGTSHMQFPLEKNSHMGIGLAVSRILCQKHGGTLSLSNSPAGGAEVKISFQI